MLSKSVETIIREIRNFQVAEMDGKLVGCCAVSFFSVDLAEIRSLAVKRDLQRHGIGALLVRSAEKTLQADGIKTAFALTLSEEFFSRLGYTKVDKARFPQKIWRDCLNCPKIMQCDEVAMEKNLETIE